MKLKNAWAVAAALLAIARPAGAQDLMPKAAAPVKRVVLGERDRDLVLRRIDEEVAKLSPGKCEATRRQLLDQLVKVERRSETVVTRAPIAERSHSSLGGVLEAAASAVVGPKVAVRQADAILRSGTFAARIARTITLPAASATETRPADDDHWTI